ncbi:MAG TPA: hypothetical protein VMV48_07390 [Gallionellaceae bacterium]|nr:hypothetical protein [Gallionellaceae bacterium]
MRSIPVWMSIACISTAVFANEYVAEPELNAARIIEKNVAAKGGLEAWRKIQSMVWIGHIERAGAANLSYVLEQKRPHKTRFEIKVQNQTAVRIYDGTHGWKLRPASNGRPELQPYTSEELIFAQNGQGIDGPLIDYQAKGIVVTLDGVDEIEGRKTYRLDVKLPSGISQHVWIDAQTFLDTKYDHQSRNALGRAGTVTVFYRNYQTIDGLQIPLTIESGSGMAQSSARLTDKMVIDRVLLNPPLEDQSFAKPSVPGLRDAVSARGETPRSMLSQHTGFPKLNTRSVPGSAGGD